MSNYFIEMINDIDFLYGFIYDCANLISNLYDYENYDHLVIKLCSEFVMPIINITKKRHIKENNIYIKNTINAFKHNRYIFIICSYLMNICCERHFNLSQDEYLEIKKLIDNNMDIIEIIWILLNQHSHLWLIILIYIENVIVIIIVRVIIIIIRKKLKIFFLVMNIMNFMKKL